VQSRQGTLNLVIPVGIRRYACDLNDIAVNAVQLGYAVLHLTDDIREITKHYFHADGVMSRF